MLKQRKTTLAVLAALAVLSFFVPAERSPAISQPNAQAPIEAPKIETPLNLVAALSARAQLAELPGDPFSREVRSAPAGTRRLAAPATAAVPAAPANPYRFAGEVRRPGATQRFLVRGSDILEVKPGDVLDGGYRVEALAESEVVLLHVASGARQALRAGAPAAAAAPAAAPLAAPALLLGAPGERIPPKAT